jgi:hypothetical protein
MEPRAKYQLLEQITLLVLSDDKPHGCYSDKLGERVCSDCKKLNCCPADYYTGDKQTPFSKSTVGIYTFSVQQVPVLGPSCCD